MAILEGFDGTWAGTNGFRLMPADPLAEFPASATVTSGAGGYLTSVTYSWEHPQDGPQDGLVVLGAGEEGDTLVALWADSWHQKPAPMSLSGQRDPDGTAALAATYGGNWGWRIVLGGDGDHGLLIRMDNVLPPERAASDVAAYPVMVMTLKRA
jgi:hypothetical protein